ncbi:nuclease, partial [Escherichia coli]|nr:nuclease [Escherichia coli]
HHREHAVQHHRGRTVPAAEKTALAGDQRADTVSGADRAQRHGRDFPGVLGADGVAGKQDCEKYPDYQRAGKHAGETRGKNLGGDVRQWREREISGVAGRGERGKHLDGGRQERREAGQGVNEYDGTG